MSDLRRCPNGCYDTDGEGVSGVPATFMWFDGSTGENKYCPECGSELVDVETESDTDE